MSRSHVHRVSDAESLSLLVKRIADRDRVAFGLLYRRLVRPVFTQPRTSLGSAAVAVPVTRAVFVEVWRLAPVSDGYRDGVRVWVAGITAARIAARLPVLSDELPVAVPMADVYPRSRVAGDEYLSGQEERGDRRGVLEGAPGDQ
jgi:RNA polymerase sigma-70 factor (ECF subfamily)